MDKVRYPTRFVVKKTDLITIKGETYRVQESDVNHILLERDVLEGGKEFLTINKTTGIDREFKGSRDVLLESICKFFNMTIADLRGGKGGKAVLARRVACVILNDEGVHPEVIAEAIGRDRTSVYANIKRAEGMEIYDKGLYNAYLTIKSTL